MRTALLLSQHAVMRRDYFTLDTGGISATDSGRPVITITYEGPPKELKTRILRGETPLTSDEIDVTFRLQTLLEDESPVGVFALADRVTGEYVLELNVDADSVLALTDAVDVESTGEKGGNYRIVLETADGTELAAYDKSTLLVYDPDGQLLREQSLIPSGVEI